MGIQAKAEARKKWSRGGRRTAMSNSGSDQGSEWSMCAPSWHVDHGHEGAAAPDPPVQDLLPTEAPLFIFTQRSQLLACIEGVHVLAQLIEGARPDTECRLAAAELCKPEAAAVEPAGAPLAAVEEPGGSSGAARNTQPPQGTLVPLPAGSSLSNLRNLLLDESAATGPCVFDLGGQTLSGDLEGDMVITLGHTLQNGVLELPPTRQLIINAGADVKVSLRTLTITGPGLPPAPGTEVSGLVHVMTGQACLDHCTIADPCQEGCCVLLVDGGAAVELVGCTLRGAKFGLGLVVQGSGSRVVARACQIHGNDRDNVCSSQGGEVALEDCVLYDSVFGLGVYDSRAVATGCEIYSNYGANVMSWGGEVALEGCKLYDSKNGAGLLVMSSGSRALARGCEIYSNYGANVHTSEGGEAILQGCKVYDCKDGVGLAAKDSWVVAMDCKIYSNKWGDTKSLGGGEVILEGCQCA